jgi:hypothetical protein
VDALLLAYAEAAACMDGVSSLQESRYGVLGCNRGMVVLGLVVSHLRRV